jgi:hypothetical protein
LKRSILLGFIIMFSSLVFAQKILVVENEKSLRNFKYAQGDDIIFKSDNIESKIVDQLYDITDSTIILSEFGEVRLDQIVCIYRENWLVRILRGLTLLGGVAYFGIDSFNRLINNDSPVILAETAIISAGMVAFSFALIPFNYRKIIIGGKWNIRMLDLNAF